MTYHIHIQGIVQGVGFRPYVFRLAQTFLLRGWVNNAGDGVHVEFNADAETAQHFFDALLQQAPALSHITNATIQQIDNQNFTNFLIIHSEEKAKPNLWITPDLGMCEDCRKELYDVQNRKFQYPFISCTNCGTRYSVIQQLPYDRERTAMKPFLMCADCQNEYDAIQDRRYFAQTNSCRACGIDLQVIKDVENHQGVENQVDIVKKTIQAILLGKIVAVKGIGGFLLLCDATQTEAIKKLRTKKFRPSKPFALMYRSIEMLEKDVFIHDYQKNILKSPQAPIVLFEFKKEVETGLKTELVAPKLAQIGVMLPYAPLFSLITEGVGKPLLATSGNRSGSPIVFQDEKAMSDLNEIADMIVGNDREIVVPQDDSVMQFSNYFQQKIMLRRSRGFAPTFLMPNSFFKKNNVLNLENESIIGLGAMLKSTFSWAHRGNIYTSQYLGDLTDYDTQQSFEHTLQHFLNLLTEKPTRIVTDLHPDYFSTQLGEQLAAAWQIPLSNRQKVQHHKAHFAAVMTENNLLGSEKPILGVIWDGTGLGEDGQIWGGEFFKYQAAQKHFEKNSFLRCYHFDYFPAILGDKMPKEPRISALCLAYDVLGAENIVNQQFTKTELNLYQKILAQKNLLQTSSVGRIFDGVASLLGLADKVSYEGEAALLLEVAAKRHFKKAGLAFNESYVQDYGSYYRVPTKTLIQNVIFDIQKGKNADYIAAKFHVSLVKIIRKVAQNVGCDSIAFSGGVFQNGLLVDLILHHLKQDFTLYFHQQLSPNDENISFGQLFLASI
jgi:hydrogenase maturation protein HypF